MINKPRSRMISVRLCEDEYQALRRMCTVNGVQNLSNFAREAMQAHLNGISLESAQYSRHDFEVRLSKLDQKIEELFKEVMSSIAELKR